jgi:serine/threonine protein phosphatase PrpC
LQLQPSDAFLLCSDGWWSSVEAEALSKLLGSAATPEGWLDSMSDVTRQQADPRQDNYSAIACWIVNEAEAHAAVDCATEADTLWPRPGPVPVQPSGGD